MRCRIKVDAARVDNPKHEVVVDADIVVVVANNSQIQYTIFVSSTFF